MYKILMATMGLELGGAETHIVELCKNLKRAGHDIVLCSSGGQLVAEVEASGVRHVTAPLASRNPRDMMTAYRILARTVKDFCPDIVHAHARIPGFLLSSICKREGIPHVTSVHGSYKVSASLRVLTKWGSKQLAVSPDIKDYLTDNYGIAPRDVFLTVNGIDTEAFCPAAVDDGLRSEFGIAEGLPLVVTVSRLDDDAVGGVERLLAATKGREDIALVVVGGGTHLERLKAAYPSAVFVGMRRDVSRFLASCDIFAGVSRAALEAMACEKPVILIGQAGYLGMLEPSKLKRAQKTNLTCRSEGFETAEEINGEITRLVSSNGLREELGAWGREVVMREYSIDRMTEDAIRCYRAAILEGRGAKYDFLLCGYYGYGNAGDEMLLETIVGNLVKQNEHVRICVLNKGKTISTHQDVALARRFSLFEVLSAMRHSRVLVFGGGNLLQDVTSVKSLVYYLAILSLAKRLGLKTMLYANGIGPLGSEMGRNLSKKVLSKVDVITLRDPDSVKLLEEIGVVAKCVELTADEVFTAIERPFDVVEGLPEKYIAVSVRGWDKVDNNFYSKIADVLEEVHDRYGLEAVLLPFQQHLDIEPCEHLYQIIESPVNIVMGEENILSAVTNADVVLGMRLHALIFGAAAGVPSVGIVYDPKVEAFFDMIGERRFVYCDGFDKEELLGHVIAAIESDKESTKEAAARLRAAANENCKAAYRLLNDEEKQ